MVIRASLLVSALSVASVAFGQTPRTTVPVPAGSPRPAPTVEIVDLSRNQIANAARLRGFSIVLVQGDMKAGGSTDGVPAAAAKAIADLKDFLPYKSYQHLDSQWILGSGQLGARLQRPGQVYDVELQTMVTSSATSPINVGRFLVKESAGQPVVQVVQGELAPPSAVLAAAEQRLQLAVMALRRAEASLDKGLVSRDAVSEAEMNVKSNEILLHQMKQQMAEARAAQQGARGVIIDSSFKMDIGETLVVGTSKIAGDKALIVLLTAVAK
jgi:hypothetical protein